MEVHESVQSPLRHRLIHERHDKPVLHLPFQIHSMSWFPICSCVLFPCLRDLKLPLMPKSLRHSPTAHSVRKKYFLIHKRSCDFCAKSLTIHFCCFQTVFHINLGIVFHRQCPLFALQVQIFPALSLNKAYRKKCKKQSSAQETPNTSLL